MAETYVDYALLAEHGKLAKTDKGTALVHGETEVPVTERDARWYIAPRLPKDPAERAGMIDMLQAIVSPGRRFNSKIAAALAEGGGAARTQNFREALANAGDAFIREMKRELTGPEKPPPPPSPRALYQQALAELTADPRNATLRFAALDAGRNYYGSLRRDRRVTIYDEQAIANDIAAATGGR